MPADRFIYMEADQKNNPVIGKFELPIKAVIEEESNAWEKRKTITKTLFNIEKSNQFAETVIGETDFDLFEETPEGNGAPNDTAGLTKAKTIYHHEFKKEFTVTEKMFEDAQWGIAAEAKKRARNFTKAYYRTQDNLAQFALYSAVSASGKYAKGTFDFTVADGHPLFYNAHTAIAETPKYATTQSNYFKLSNSVDTGLDSTAGVVDALQRAVIAMRNFMDENGEAIGYTPDTIILPGNSTLEFRVKAALGAEYKAGGSDNDINTQYGNWNIVVLPQWTLGSSAKPQMILMSSEANEALSGNMLYQRAPLRIRNWVDNHTGNYIWNGRCRFGIGFGAWKHIAYITADHSDANASLLGS